MILGFERKNIRFAQRSSRNHKKNNWLSLVIILTELTLIFSGCNSNSATDIYTKVENIIGIDVSEGDIIGNKNSDASFGDGFSFYVLGFSDDSILDEIIASGMWNDLPMCDVMNILCYGTSNKDSEYGPYITDEVGNCLFPKIENGYYYFYDRHEESKNPFDCSQVLDRNSMNLTILIYDNDEKQLYYCEYDS